MAKRGRKYIYISNVNFDGTIFQTQVLDWLHLYKEQGLNFDLIQLYPIKYLKKPSYIKQQLRGIRKRTKLFTGTLYLFPSKGIFYLINALIIYFKIIKYILRNKEVLIFSRAIIGKEIAFLRKISPIRITFYFDGRAAAAEEQKYGALKNCNFSLNKYITIANIYYLVYRTLCAADKIFVVSRVLQKYFQDTYLMDQKKYILYPCLSDSKKFYLSSKDRKELRESLKIEDQTKVFIYSGGISSDWHVSDIMFAFLERLVTFGREFKFLCLTIETENVGQLLQRFPSLRPHLLLFTIPNNEVQRYLNAADYGILFRENTIMNNVASPTKFAEYMLCGLPVLISEGVGDYSEFALKQNLGFLIKESDLKDPATFDFTSLFESSFDRKHIAEIGRKNFSKESAINNILSELKF